MPESVTWREARAEPEPITADWLRAVGFKWHQLDRQPERHWLLWLEVDDGPRFEELGVELAPCRHDGTWFCWVRSDTAHRYSRFLHVRHLRATLEVARLVEGLTGRPWDPTTHIAGSARTPEAVARYRAEGERLDRLMLGATAAWREIEKDDSCGGALPEHREAYEAQRQPKKDGR